MNGRNPRARAVRVLRLVGWLTVGAAALAALVWTLLTAVPAWQLLGRWPTLVASFADWGLPAAVVASAGWLVLARRPGVRVLAVLPAALLAWQLVLGWPGPARPAAPAAANLTVATLNLQFGKAEPGAAAAAVARQSPDVLVLQEITESTLAELRARGTFASLPYEAGAPGHDYIPGQGSDASGMMIFSRHPLTVLDNAPDPARHTVRVERPAGAFVLIGTHPANPRHDWERWLADHDALAGDVAARLGEPVVVAGDLNAVNKHAPLQRLAALGVLDTAPRTGAWWLPTWPTEGWCPPVLAIDHVLTGPGIDPVSAETFPVPGTDHLGLSVRLRLP